MKQPEQPDPPGAPFRPCSWSELDQPDSLWNRAAALTPQGDAFCCRTEWQLSFHETFAPQRDLHLVRGGDSLIAFAESEDPTIGPLLMPVESHWLFGCPLLGADAVDLLAAFLDERSSQSGASVLVSGLLPGSSLLRSLVTTFGQRYQILQLEPTTLCSASLAGGLDGLLSRRSTSLRKNLRRAARRATASGVRFERCAPQTAAEAASVYARMLLVEQASWKGIGRCGMAEPPSREFYAAMLRRLAVSGNGRVMFARCDDDDIGFIFGGLAGTVYRGQQFSYVEDWRNFSIGNLLQLEQIRWLCEQGAAHYDMGPLMDYKHLWTETRIQIESRLLRAT